ncbi:sugar phosphate isomerase/epimerase family protein [Ktedonobacter racemifer]|uniref:Xylose isomerase domain protein TIM barrel n=1 Tax=Ktedonobacter racemifer DSM 44963 TaxID=485913 RepID=D6TYU9_KTERA|nr:TIM barrel protein [Ktedonobacter racemifer]EFH85174.1 Xylose isomerase domain protein TIM barrel [Ktedonobacter racemifer DSM 44963]
MKMAFSKPTADADEQQLLFSHFRSAGYGGLQLKAGQYREYVAQSERFLEKWGDDARDLASGLITGGLLDEAGIADLRALFKFAQAVGSERIIFCHAQPREGLSNADIQSYACILSDLGKEAQQYGIALSLHHHYNQPVMYRQDFAVFFDAVSDQTIKLTVDTAHLIKSGIDDIAGIIRDYRMVLDNMHIKDIADNEFKVLGKGTIDFTPVFAALHDVGYQGWLCADEESGDDLTGAMETCAQFLTSHYV